jgi:hypothetical protein
MIHADTWIGNGAIAKWLSGVSDVIFVNVHVC